VLALGALGRLVGWDDDTILWIYDGVIATVAIGLSTCSAAGGRTRS
jgi:hypothetical protein